MRPRSAVFISVLAMAAGAAATGAPEADATTARSATAYAFPIPGTHYASAKTEIAFRGPSSKVIKDITVTGSKSGKHSGRIVADSDGKGASFIPSKPFKAGEKVTVKTPLGIVGGRSGQFSFTVATGAAPIGPLVIPAPPGVTLQKQSFVTRPDLTPPVLTTTSATAALPGDSLTTPFGPSTSGLEIDDAHGSLLYYLPAPAGTEVANLREQTYKGKPVLTWWQGTIAAAGFGEGVYKIADTHYHVLATVKAGNGLTGDIHEFSLTSRGTALITSYVPTTVDARTSGASAHQEVLDSVIQEIDVATGRVLFDWHALDHIPFSASYTRPLSTGIWDYTHINSIQAFGLNSLIVSMRNTHAIYIIDRSTGKITGIIGGKYSTVKEPSSLVTNSQHDAEPHPGNELTIFDNGAGAGAASRTASRGLVVKYQNGRLTPVLELDAPQGQLAATQGSIQPVGGDYFIDFGDTGTMVLFDSTGAPIREMSFQHPIQSYRGFIANWHATPDTAPDVVSYVTAGVGTTVYVSWNGATDVASWRVLVGPTATPTHVYDEPRSGFETSLTIPDKTGIERVQALSASGKVLGESQPTSIG